MVPWSSRVQNMVPCSSRVQYMVPGSSRAHNMVPWSGKVQYMVSWSNGFDRRDVTFDQLVANGTTPGTYAYQMTRNRYTADDKYEIRKHSARYGGSRSSGGYQHDQRDDDAKRQRRR